MIINLTNGKYALVARNIAMKRLQGEFARCE